ncbi:MAG: hypothetical protein L3J02_06065, partial [Henriciella sp.]|nr:hypothetical protein [Henriciella sp.]
MTSGKIQDLGDWAEDAFSGLCSKSGITRNKSSQDRSGWDYIIQFPARRIDKLPSDMQPGEKSARVQVKSKGRGKPSIALSLSNAVKFAKEPMPCFVVLFLATDKAEPVRLYAKHFWADEIARTLKRVRKADADGKSDFHKMTLSISFADADAHDGDLLEWMRRTSDQFGENY